MTISFSAHLRSGPPIAEATIRMQLSSPDHPALALLPEVPTQDQIERFGQLIESLEGEHGIVDISTMHHHAQGLYGRSVVIKADTFLVGLAHKAGHLNVCVGDVTVWTSAGRKRLTGAHILPADAGVMRVGFAHSDTTWFSIHRNDTGTTDERAIEDSLIEHAERLMTRRFPGLAEYTSSKTGAEPVATQPDLRIAA